MITLYATAARWRSSASSAARLPKSRAPVFPRTCEIMCDGVVSLSNVMVAHRVVTSAWGVGGLVPLRSIRPRTPLASVAAFMLGEHVATQRFV